MKMAVFWVVAPCSLAEVYQRLEVLAASIIRAMSKPRAWNRFEIQELASQGRNLDRTCGEKGRDRARPRNQ
jgi:hypothetical protein